MLEDEMNKRNETNEKKTKEREILLKNGVRILPPY
jgi:hypothetical protein